MKEERNIDELFRSSFEDFEIAPPASVKKTIDSRIAGESSSRKGWWFSALIVLIGGGIFAAVYFGRSAATHRPAAGAMASNAPSPSNTNASTSYTHTASAGSATGSGSAAATNTKTPSTGQTGMDDPAGKPNQGLKGGMSASGNHASGNDLSTHGKKRALTNKRSGGKPAASGKAGKQHKKHLSAGKAGKKGSKSGTGTAGAGSDNFGNSGGSSGGSENGSSGETLLSGAPDPGKTPIPTPTAPDPEQLKKDSLLTAQKEQQKKDSIARIDDSSYEENTSASVKPKKKPEDQPLWMASVYAGPQFGFNRTPTDPSKTFTEKSAFQFSGEINRSLFAGYGLSTGLNYSTKREESMEFKSMDIDTYYTLDSTPIWNQNQDSIIGWTYIDVLHTDTTDHIYRQLNTVSSFGFPIYLNKQFELNDQWGILVNAGAQFNFYKITLGAAQDSIPPPQTNDFSVNIVGRIHATYRWNNWLFSAGVAGGYDLKPAIIYQERKRYYLTPQVGIHWTF